MKNSFISPDDYLCSVKVIVSYDDHLSRFKRIYRFRFRNDSWRIIPDTLGESDYRSGS